jgi:biopolymer transport protein TolR
MGMQVGSSKGQMAEPNVVPLIDVLLVLIIIFMVITPLTPKGLEALVPQPPPPGAQANPDILAKTVVVQIERGGSVKINEEPSTWETLGPRLEDIFKTRAEKVAFVKGDDEIQFADVARAIDIMRAAGVEKVGLITAKIEAGQ